MDKMTKTDEQVEVQEKKPGPWAEKLNSWRVSPVKHWAWRKDVERFLRGKAKEENERVS
jgi:hypothetical protein